MCVINSALDDSMERISDQTTEALASLIMFEVSTLYHYIFPSLYLPSSRQCTVAAQQQPSHERPQAAPPVS
jgi:hypothetical protein